MSGNVGIGTTSPAEKLDVSGKIRATHLCASDGSNCKDLSSSWSAGSVTSVSIGGLPLSVTNATSTPQISIAQANGTTAGYLTAADWTSFNSKLDSIVGASLADGKIWLGNASNQSAAVTPTGDVTITNAGVTAIGVSKVTTTMIAADAVTSAKILDASVGVGDLNFAGTMAVNTGLVVRNGTQFFNQSCGANETLIWTVANGWACNAVLLSESDPKVGSNTTNFAAKWNGSALVASGIYESGGNVGIGTTTPAEKLSVASTIESTSGGIKFPDGTVQTTSASAGSGNLDIRKGSAALLTGITLSGTTPTLTANIPVTLPEDTRAIIVGVYYIHSSSTSSTHGYLAFNAYQTGTTEADYKANYTSQHFDDYANSDYTEILVPWRPGLIDQVSVQVTSSHNTDPLNTYNVYYRGYISGSGGPSSAGSWNETDGNAYRSTGNVGIGTTSPAEKLEVTGNVKVSGTISGLSNSIEYKTCTSGGAANIDNCTATCSVGYVVIGGGCEVGGGGAYNQVYATKPTAGHDGWYCQVSVDWDHGATMIAIGHAICVKQ